MRKIVFIGLLLVIKTNLYSQNNLNHSQVFSVNKKSMNGQSIYSQEINDAFNTHYAYFTEQIRKRMTKDPDGCGSNAAAANEGGCSDTYVLYNVQVYMQNAIIYADEQADIEMIEKLLKLVLIPFEAQYISKDGLWLNNRDEVPNYPKYHGVEMKLPLSQYFSLLTRVLAAAQRHNVSTNITQRETKIMIDHIDTWMNEVPVSLTPRDISDTHMHNVMSALQFADYASKSGITIQNLDNWKGIAQEYLKNQIKPRWEKVDCKDGNGTVVDNCYAFYRRDTPHEDNYKYSGYGSELTKTSSDTDPNAMFGANGLAKHPPKYAKRVGWDLSHGRRFNHFFEAVKRFGTLFKVAISEDKLQGWANNLAYRVSVGTVEDPKFTIFCDGVDGWYRVNYDGGSGPRLNSGTTSGDMDIHFVASSYGMLGVYNPKIYTWMKAWAKKHPRKIDDYYGGYLLDYYTSMSINMAMDFNKTIEPESFVSKNPSDQFFDFSFNSSYKGEISIRIFSVEGKQIKALTFQKTNQLFNHQIDLSNQASALYIVHFRAGSYAKVHKIIKN